MNAITLGPLSMNANLLFGLLALLSVFVVAGYLDKKHSFRLERGLWLMLVAAVILGRALFVAVYWEQYKGSLVAILDLRDGGFYWPVALALALTVSIIWMVKNSTVKKALIRLWLTGGLLFGLSLGVYGLLKPVEQLTLPALELRTLSQEPVVLSQFKGKPIVLNLWATWCPPCRREMPVLETAQQNHSDLHFVFVNQAESAELVSAYLEAEQLSLDNMLLDQDMDLARSIKNRALPTTLFIDANGKVQSSRMGELSAATLESYLQELRRK